MSAFLKHVFVSVGFLATVWGCNERPAAPTKSPTQAEKAATSPTTHKGEVAPVGLASSSPLSHPAADVIVAIGDVHGDLDATRRVLRLAGVLGPDDAWVGERRVVVQTGDEIDRGDDDRAVLDLFARLAAEAQKAGGKVIALSGNHELMNVMGDFRYVTPGGFSTFVDSGGRGAAFRPGGPYGKLLAERPIFARVGDNVFVHGGILMKHVKYGLDRMQRELSAWMRGNAKEPPAIAMVEDAPIWTRAYSDDPSEADCRELASVLAALDARRMIVGHTPQRNGITPACDGQVFRIDVGMAKHYGGPVQALQIEGDQITTLREP